MAKKAAKTAKPVKVRRHAVAVYFVDLKLFADLAEYAAEDHRPLSSAITMILRKFFEERKAKLAIPDPFDAQTPVTSSR